MEIVAFVCGLLFGLLVGIVGAFAFMVHLGQKWGRK
jgi:hypothetical protein